MIALSCCEDDDDLLGRTTDEDEDVAYIIFVNCFSDCYDPCFDVPKRQDLVLSSSDRDKTALHSFPM